MTDTSDEFEVIPSFFQGSNVDNSGDNDAESPNAEIDDALIRNAIALPMFSKESEAEANLRQTGHSNEEGVCLKVKMWKPLSVSRVCNVHGTCLIAASEFCVGKLLEFFCLPFIVMMMSLHLGSGPLSLTCCVCLMARK